MKRLIQQEGGLCIVECTVLAALLFGVMLPALAMIADNVLDILNDLAEDLDQIDDLIANADIDCLLPESNEDSDSEDGCYGWVWEPL